MPTLATKPKFRLMAEIIKRSVASTWHEARLEWLLQDVTYADRDAPGVCLCGHRPIRELCILRNRENGNQTIVGNCCVTKFMGLESQKVFGGLRRVSENHGKAANQEMIDLASERGCLSAWERKFLADTMRKRRLSEKQKMKRAEINATILNCLGQPALKGSLRK